MGTQVDPSKPLFGFIGRLEEQKGVDILLAALPEIAEKGDVQACSLLLLCPPIITQITSGAHMPFQ
jgi:glycogen synthase